MRKLRSVATGVGLVTVLCVTAACATIMHGTSQDIGISSTPSGAQVTIDNMEHGTTPIIADLKRKEQHLVVIELEGYQRFEMHLTKSVSGWVFGNIIFGGLIGLAVDAISGGLYNLKPDQVVGQLAATTAGVDKDSDVFFIQVVLSPDPSWEKIGTLVPVSGR
jgi:hypothetical protein